MKKELMLLALVAWPFAGLQAAELPEELVALVHANRYPLSVTEAGISGDGGVRLVNEARAADVVMFGENHGTREIAELADALYLASSESAPRLLVTEISPLSARVVERRLREGSLETFLAEGLNLQTLPFFSVDAELALPRSALAAWPEREGVIWGLDQEFMAAAPLLFGALEQMATSDEERDAVAAAQRARLLNPFLIGMGSGEALQALQATFENAARTDARELIQLMTLSHKIYKEQMGGDAQWSNARREQLMVEHFLRYAGNETQWQPLFMKFGATHLFRVPGPTVKEPLGMRVAEWAGEQQRSSLNVYVDCANGEALDFLLGGTNQCDPYLLRDALFRGSLIDNKPTLFDLRPLRDHPALGETSRLTRMIVEGYDYLVLIPGTTSSSYLPGTLVAHRYGAIAIAFLLLLLTTVVWLVRRWWRKRKAA